MSLQRRVDLMVLAAAAVVIGLLICVGQVAHG